MTWVTWSALAVTPAPDGGYPGENTAEGDNALLSLSSGTGNTALGFQALRSNTVGGGGNTATGADALASNVNGNDNTGVGDSVLEVSTGDSNTAIGSAAMTGNTSGGGNTAIGWAAL